MCYIFWRWRLFQFKNNFLKKILLLNKVYTQAEIDAIVSTRNEAAAQQIVQIKNNTQTAIAALVIHKINFFFLKTI